MLTLSGDDVVDRKAEVVRKTRETEVRLKLDLDGAGETKVECEEQFLRHMVETLGRYADFDLTLEATGDDVHHLVEDVAIVLGKTLKQCLGETPIERTAFSTIPMDDALVQVAVDIIERPYADVDCPDALYTHFFRSFAMSSGITMHIMVIRGYDEHHIVEASFKALGRALRSAVRPRQSELSTKDRPRVSRK
jgi:imidazoleglycerol-phosphate dehydratase